FDPHAVSLFEDLAGELGVGLGRLRDRDRLMTTLGERALLISAIEQAGEAIVLTDPFSTITYANPAVSRISGYTREELIGANPRVFQSGHHPHEFYLDMWSTLLSGRSWRGVLVNRSKGGSLFEEDATISPIHNAEGALVAYVAVKHDLTNERRLEASLDQARADHGAIVAAMRDVQPAETVHASAGAFCEAATRLPGVDAAAVLLLDGERALLPVGVSGSRVLDAGGPTSIALADLDPLAELARGAVALPLEPRRWAGNDELLSRVIAEGVRAIVLAPLRWERRAIGLLAFATRSPTVAEDVGERLAFYEELASYAGTLLGSQAHAFELRAQVGTRVREVLEHRRFHAVFQPVVDLVTSRVVGYEALTRFDDARRPDEVFAEAHTVGLGTRLEAACAASALDAFAAADPELGLSLNFSPAALLDGSAAGVVVGCGRRVTIEVTEHAPIDDFAAVRRAVAAIPGASLAVDDAGAGFASLHHILELRPAFVKLDLSIVRDVDTDRVRQAMAAGLCHFARLSDVTIVAEGVETHSEADALRELGVALGPGRLLGQGFFFGRAGPAPATAGGSALD
ncbi:MAG TPA: EAL domain-containing protein, partial [Acidimicrobiales bacterium]|nr:EAL domain-containing protein [Acidimicrobiales bacterium]